MRLVGSNKISTSCMHNYCWFSLVGKKQKAEGDFLEWLCDRLARHHFRGDSIIVALFLATWFSGKDPLPWCLSLAARTELWLKKASSRDRCLKYSFNLLSCKAPAIVFTFILNMNCFIIRQCVRWEYTLRGTPVSSIMHSHKLLLINTICVGVLDSSLKVHK